MYAHTLSHRFENATLLAVFAPYNPIISFSFKARSVKTFIDVHVNFSHYDFDRLLAERAFKASFNLGQNMWGLFSLSLSFFSTMNGILYICNFQLFFPISRGQCWSGLVAVVLTNAKQHCLVGMMCARLRVGVGVGGGWEQDTRILRERNSALSLCDVRGG